MSATLQQDFFINKAERFLVNWGWWLMYSQTSVCAHCWKKILVNQFDPSLPNQPYQDEQVISLNLDKLKKELFPQNIFHNKIRFSIWWMSCSIINIHVYPETKKIIKNKYKNINANKRYKNRNTQKVIQSLQLHVSYLFRFYSRVKAITGLSYTCFGVFGH